jgi:hypothetical protein
MCMCDETIANLKQMVTAAREEFGPDRMLLASTPRERRRPDRLYARLGTSYATQAFQVTRSALRQEVILEFVSLWDVDKQAKVVRMRRTNGLRIYNPQRQSDNV